jgi:hypothetical protein
MTTCAEVETLGGQPVIGKRLLPRCSSRSRRLRSQKGTKVRFPRAGCRRSGATPPRRWAPGRRSKYRSPGRKRRYDLQHPCGTVESRFGLFHSKMKERGPHQMEGRFGASFRACSKQHRAFSLCPSSSSASLPTPTCERIIHRFLPERFPQLFQPSSAMGVYMLPAQ